jgi:cyanoexosortase B-associated protein
MNHEQRFYQSLSWQKTILLLLLLSLIFLGALPGYLTGTWRWANPPVVQTLDQLRNLRKTGIQIAGWKTLQQDTIPIGGHNWVMQKIQQNPKTQAIVLLLPQSDPTDQPQVEWTDIQGVQRWKLDSRQVVNFTASVPTSAGSESSTQTATVTAQYARAINNRQTYALLQWYAFPTGGNPTPSQWFWADRHAQLSNHRVPWVAVSIQIYIEPFGDISQTQELAQSLGQTVQAALMSEALKVNSDE